MSIRCDVCSENMPAQAYEAKMELKKKGGKRTTVVKLADVCPGCANKLAENFGGKLPGRFGKRKKTRKSKPEPKPEPKMKPLEQKPKERKPKEQPPEPSFSVPPAPIVGDE